MELDREVVSADLHRDETTPHIHATVVRIVTGERRKVREQKKCEPGQGEDSKSGKRTYRKAPLTPSAYTLTT